MCLGPYTLGAQYGFMKQGKLRQKSVADVKKLYIPFLPFANVQTLRKRDVDPDFYFSDDIVKYVSLDKPIKTGVLATQSNQSKPLQSPSNEPVKRILCRYIEKKNDYAVPKMYGLVNEN